MGGHAHPPRHRGVAGPAAEAARRRRRHHPLPPRTLGRQGLPGGPARGGHLPARPDLHDRRRVRRDDHRPALPPLARHRPGPRGARGARRDAVRPRRRACVARPRRRARSRRPPAAAADVTVPPSRDPAPLIEVTRRDARDGAEVVESVHAGDLVVVDGDGRTHVALGDPHRPTFVRSTSKPFQATACLELLALSGGTPTPPEIAVSWASHRGEPQHVSTVRRLLARSATEPAQLTCPASPSEADPGAVPAPILHNCSGKHALFALAGQHQGTTRERLLDLDGPLQRVVLGAVEDALGPVSAIGIDGCGAPAVAVPLAALAGAYVDLLVADRWASVREAGLAHPQLVGGEGRLESALLAEGVVAKVGAEGVFAAAWRGRDGTPFGVAVKITDGTARAATTAVWSLLAAREVVPADRWVPDHPRSGETVVGRIRATDTLRAVVGG
ncbi:asparaginase [Nitriliruptoraceae bacterium ZYF776]|nr:asparaginase [Profundirhabdus halotolerans]